MSKFTSLPTQGYILGIFVKNHTNIKLEILTTRHWPRHVGRLLTKSVNRKPENHQNFKPCNRVELYRLLPPDGYTSHHVQRPKFHKTYSIKTNEAFAFVDFFHSVGWAIIFVELHLGLHLHSLLDDINRKPQSTREELCWKSCEKVTCRLIFLKKLHKLLITSYFDNTIFVFS